MNINFTPLFIGFDIGKKHISFGWCYKLETFLDEISLKPQLKTRKVGYHWFCAISEYKPPEAYKAEYEMMLANWNRGSLNGKL